MAVAAYASGSKLRASRLNEMITYMTRLTAEKPSVTSRNTTISRTADPHLVIPMAANTTYDFRSLLIVASQANSAGDFSGEWQYPSDGVMSFTAHGLIDTLAGGTSGDLQAGAISLDTASPAGQFIMGCSTSDSGVILVGRLTTVTAGNLTLAWAQNSSSAQNTHLRGGSSVTLSPVG